MNGWQLNTILSAATGTPITVVSGTDRSLSGVGNDYSDLIGSPARLAGANRLTQYFNTAAFQQAAIGTFGNSSRGILRGPGTVGLDVSGFKVIPVTERVKLQFRTEAFNVINRANLGNPGSSVAATASFGRITSSSAPRVIQFALRATF